MAERRMFSKSITNSGKFLRMPVTARLLYYDLGMNADDDGIVDAYTVMCQTKSTEDDLKILIAKGYVILLNEDLVIYLCHWEVNNKIRVDRYKPSIYLGLKQEVLGIIESTCQPIDNQLSTNCQPTVNQLTTNCQPTVNQLTTNCQPIDNQLVDSWNPQVRVGKDRLGKDSIGVYTGKKKLNNKGDTQMHTHTHIYKELTKEEYDSLVEQFGKVFVERRIERAMNYKNSMNYETILSWCVEDKIRNKSKLKNESLEEYNRFKNNKYDYDALEKELLNH